MGAAPSQPSCVGGQVTLVAKSAPCSAGLFEPDLAMGGLPCTLQEYDAILNAARPLGQPAPCQNGCARPRTGDEVCLRAPTQHILPASGVFRQHTVDSTMRKILVSLHTRTHYNIVGCACCWRRAQRHVALRVSTWWRFLVSARAGNSL